MDIKILKNKGHFDGKVVDTNLIFEREKDSSTFENLHVMKYYLHNLDSNERQELLPQSLKYNCAKIYNLTYPIQAVYFTTSCKMEDGSMKIDLVRYELETGEGTVLYSIQEELEKINTEVSYRFFILNDTYLLIQKAKRKYTNAGNYYGFFEFELSLYNSKEKQLYPVLDENLLQNGIEWMQVLSETILVMKTGFNLLDENRYQVMEQEDVSIESISILNKGQMISDLIMEKDALDMETIERSYYEMTIPYVKVSGDYLIYSKVDNVKQEEEVIFYNWKTTQKSNCINKNVVRKLDLAKAYIIGNHPFISVDKQSGTEFLNLDTNKIEITLEEDQKLETVKNDFFVVSKSVKKPLFLKEVTELSVYKYPSMTLLHTEKGEYADAISPDGENIFIFFK